jgi:hypothetical protein
MMGEEDEAEVSIRLEKDVMLELAMFAHEVHATMNDLIVDILTISSEAWELRRRGSRNGREGHYVGKHRGRHLRGRDAFCFYYQPDSSVAWLLASKRGRSLKARRPRYTSKADRA